MTWCVSLVIPLFSCLCGFRKKPYLGHHKTASILVERVKHRSKSKKLKVYAKKQKSLGKVVGELKKEVGELKKAALFEGKRSCHAVTETFSSNLYYFQAMKVCESWPKLQSKPKICENSKN